MQYLVIGLTCVFLFLGFFTYEWIMNNRANKDKAHKINQNFGKRQNREYKLDEFQGIKQYFFKYGGESGIDEITANDLDIDKIFMEYNYSVSGAGDDYFYYRLRTPVESPEKLKTDEPKIQYVLENKEVRKSLIQYFLGIGRMNRVSFTDFIDVLESAEPKSVMPDVLCLILIFLSVGLIFINAPIGILALVSTFAFNIISYYKKRGEMEAYTVGCSYIMSFLSNVKKLDSYKGTPIEEDISNIQDICKKLNKMSRSYSFVSKSYRQTGAGNPLDIFADYIKMTLHIDIIKFNILLAKFKEHISDFEKLYYLTGKLESYINIASFREALTGYSIPEIDNSFIGINAKNVYHPLLENPVKNDIDTKKSVLITGSNASGKSTFLKAVAINVLLSETINTCAADMFKCPKYTIFSSMSLRDDITKGDSYFMAEIKSFKRIVDYVDKHNEKVIAFTDELLRGTNTIERIAACNSILKNLASANTLVFSATHDIELTDLLEGQYANYHFDEDFVDDDVVFNYKIKEGKATSKNAIKLLNVMGFDDDVVNKAQNLADKFLVEGKWA